MKSLSNSLVVFALLLLVSGCGGSQFPVKPAKGKVVSGGQPVTSGSITFVPMNTAGALEAGKPASGAIGPDGSFVLSTFGRFDGAIVGKHNVHYVGSEDEASDEEGATVAEGAEEPVSRPAARQQPKPQYVQKGEIVVEVTSGGPNEFTIDLQSGAQ